VEGELETRFLIPFLLMSRYRFARWKDPSIKAYQTRKALAVARYAVARSRFFKEHYRGRDLDDVWTLPTVDKTSMMENLTDYNTLGLTKEEILRFCLEVERSRDFTRRYKGLNIGMSSGTSGSIGIEITTPYEERYLRALFFSRYPLLKGEKMNVAFILRVSTPAFDLKKAGHRLTYIDQLQPIEVVLRRLNELSPNVLSGPPSYLRLLANEKNAGRLHIRPRRIVSYAEVLYPDIADYLKETFGCELHEIYKCTEGAIAMSCREGSLHVNEDLVALQTLNRDMTPSEPGTPCHKLIVTDLHKRSQPIIRYELNDILTMSPKRCRCGSSFRVIERVQGRADDMFIALDRNGGTQYIFPDLIGRAIIAASPGISEFQAIQVAMERVEVRVRTSKADPEINGQIRNNINAVYSHFNSDPPRIDILPWSSEDTSKFRRVFRQLRDEG
jgi:putative adenylate-forming enzyme